METSETGHGAQALAERTLSIPGPPPSAVMSDPLFAAERKKFLAETTAYVEKHHVNEVFDDLLKELVMHCPADPIEHLIKYLQQPPTVRVVLLGPQVQLPFLDGTAFTRVSAHPNERN